jgi:spore coat polysaccharide biosynthesis predicted glycosyltransferase SpsG
MKALFIVDDVHGQGHVVRSGALRDELGRRGWVIEGRVTSSVIDVSVYDGIKVFDGPPYRYNVVISDEPVSYAEGMTLLVAGGAGATEEMYKDCGAKKVLAGPQYALLRPEFSKIRVRKEQGSWFTDIRPMRGFSTECVASVMRSVAVVITHGGMRAMECACVGAPMVIVPRNEGERMNARALRIAGAALIADEKSAEQVAKDLLEHPRWLQVMSKRGRELVDGLGVQRVADSIEELVK